jgi:ADP-heptose:LPS heptosyltransferase
MSANPQGILFRIGGLGDLLVALPSISLVRQSLPDHILTLVGRPEYAVLLIRSGLVNEFVSFDDPRISSLFQGEEGPVSGHPWLSRFRLAMGWLGRLGDWPADDWWTKHGVESAHFMAYQDGVNMPMSRFFFERTHDFIKDIKVMTPADRRCCQRDVAENPARGSDDIFAAHSRLPIDRALRQEGLGYFGLGPLGRKTRRLVIHPGSGGRTKRWPFARFLEVIRRAASLGFEGVLVTGEAEADYELLLKREPLPAGWSWAARPPLLMLAGLLAESTAYLGNDSGPTHLAAACGASVVALFRADNEPAWRPFGKTRVISAPSIEDIPLASVLSALEL